MKRRGIPNNVNRNHQEYHEPGRFRQWLCKGMKGRRLLCVCRIIGIIIIALTALLVILPNLPPVKQVILSRLNRRTSALLSCKVTIGAITLDIRNGLTARNVVLSDPYSRAAPLRVKWIAARIDLMALLRGRFELCSIKFSGFTGELLNMRQGLLLGPVDIARLTAPVPPKQRKTAGKLKPLVRTVIAERCTISYIDSIKEITASGTVTSARLEFFRADSLSLVMRAGAGYFSSPVWNGAVRSIDVQGTIGPASLLLSKARIQGDSVLLTLNGTIPFLMEKTCNITVNAETFGAGFPILFKNVPSVKRVGKLMARGVMTGTFARPVLDATVTGYGLQVGPVIADSLYLQAQYSDDQLNGKARLGSPLGTAGASVRAEVRHLWSSPAVGRYTIAASAVNVDIRHLISTLPQEWYRPVSLSGAEFYASGSGLRYLPDTLSADLRNVSNPTAASPVNMTIRLAGNWWNLDATMKPDCEVKGNGRYTDRGGIDGSFHVQADNIARILSVYSKESVRGSITADALISGTIGNPAISATIQSTDLYWRNVQVSKLWGRLILRDKLLGIDSSYIAANGSMASALRGLVPGEFNGKAWVQAGVSGRLDSLRISGDLQISRCSYGRYQADTVFAYCRYADQNLRWQSLTVKRGESVFLSNGMVSWTMRDISMNTDSKLTLDNHAAGTFSAKARIVNKSVEASVVLEDLNPVVMTPWFPQALRLQGSLGVHGTMTGTTEKPDIQLNFSYDHENSRDPGFTMTGELAFANSIATATVNGVQKGSAIPLTITAHLPLNLHELTRGIDFLPDGSVVTASGDSVAYGSLIHFFAPSVQSLGTISIHGTLVKVDDEWELSCRTHIVNHKLTVRRKRIKAGRAVLDLRIDGPLVRPEAYFTLNGDSINSSGSLITSYSSSGSMVNDVLKLDTLRLTGSGGGADISAMVPVTLKNGFSFDKNSRISATFTAMPFSITQLLMPDPVTINKGAISGRVVVETTAQGARQAAGTLSLRNGECDLYECDRPLGPLSVDIDFENDSIILRRLKADWGGGRISGSGRAELDAKGVLTAQSVIKLSDVRLDGCTENLDLGIQTADIHFTKDSLVTIKVDALLSDTRFTQDFSLINLGEQIKRKAQQPQRPPNPLYNKVVMRIAVNLNSYLTFDSNLGIMHIDGTVMVAGRPDNPSIAGQFQILNGFIYYLDRKFTVTQGTIRQFDPQRINPSLDVTATSAVSWYPPQGGKEDYEITLLINGDLSNPAITLSSVPSLPQQQIISLMTFGSIQMGMGTDLGPLTGSLVSQQLAGFGIRKLARFLNVESINIYGNIFGPSSEGPQLSVTKQVSSRVVVNYKTGLSTLSQQMILVSYRLLPFLYIEAETDRRTQSGIDLKFRYSH